MQNPPQVQFGTPYPTPGGAQVSPILPPEQPGARIGGPLPAAPAYPAPAPQPPVQPQPKPKPILPPEPITPFQPILPPEEEPAPAAPTPRTPERIQPPEPILPPEVPEPLSIPKQNPQKPQEPDRIVPPAEVPSVEAPLPIDIPGFTQAAPRIFVGQQPFPDGVNWLQKQGYRTIVYLRTPGTDDQAARRQFEGKGLRFTSIEVSPQTVNRQTLDQLMRILEEEKNHPVFIYDRDSYLTGGMWYLKLRVNDMMDSAQALQEAQRLGLNPDQDPNHRAMWNAVRQLGER